jgi:chromatin segregation and condensation protein Rec8/ScpA/Scc1 (kleisin family)
MKVDLDELASIIDSRLADIRAKIAELDRQQTKLQEQRAQVTSIRTMVEELLGAIHQEEDLDSQNCTDEDSGEKDVKGVQKLAYLKAEQEGFTGNPDEHWNAAEEDLGHERPDE